MCLGACKGSETNVHLGIKAALLSNLKASIFQKIFKVSEGSEVLYWFLCIWKSPFSVPGGITEIDAASCLTPADTTQSISVWKWSVCKVGDTSLAEIAPMQKD